jgi:predicted component of type VI protein secretion system
MSWEGFDHLCIGRRQELELQLSDGTISRRHAELAYKESLGWVVRDLGSTNGTFLNGIRIGADEHPLRERDLLQLGNLVLRVTRMEQAEIDTIENFGGTVEIETIPQPSPAEVPEMIACKPAQQPSTDSRLQRLLQAGQVFHQDDSVDEMLQKSLSNVVRALGARCAVLATR